MPKKKESDAVDTTSNIDVTAENAADEKVVSKPKKDQKETPAPRVISLDDMEEFDPSATHEDLSEDDKFDDEDESF